ncbi:MAG: glycosyltransferase, partial [Planctomycetes bacterium]|nr:glycosyltransferase [Planctomycetota bacterium]
MDSSDVKKSHLENPHVSIVIPVYNEEGNIAEVSAEVVEVLGQQEWSYELIMVDDGSTDATLVEAQRVVADHERACVIELRRNYGKSAALNAGFDHACGEVVVTMDGDGQNDPRDIPK